MAVRVQVVVDRLERERFRRRAAEQGLSLSAWFREAGREKAAGSTSRTSATPKFFAARAAEPRFPGTRGRTRTSTGGAATAEILSCDSYL